MPRWAISAPRKKLPPPTTIATCTPLRTTSLTCRAMSEDDVEVEADRTAAEDLAGQLEQHPAVLGIGHGRFGAEGRYGSPARGEAASLSLLTGGGLLVSRCSGVPSGRPGRP